MTGNDLYLLLSVKSYFNRFRFALFFPEKRPSFLDGSEVFGSTQ